MPGLRLSDRASACRPSIIPSRGARRPTAPGALQGVVPEVHHRRAARGKTPPTDRSPRVQDPSRPLRAPAERSSRTLTREREQEERSEGRSVVRIPGAPDRPRRRATAGRRAGVVPAWWVYQTRRPGTFIGDVVTSRRRTGPYATTSITM